MPNLQFLNRTKIAEYFGVSLTAIDSWTRKGCPFERKGKSLRFDPQAVSQWLAGYRQETVAPDEKPDSATERYRLAKAIKAEIENLVLQGQYVDRSTVAEELVKRIVVLKGDFKSLERKLAKYPEAQNIVKRHHHTMMVTYSRRSGVFHDRRTR